MHRYSLRYLLLEMGAVGLALSALRGAMLYGQAPLREQMPVICSLIIFGATALGGMAGRKGMCRGAIAGMVIATGFAALFWIRLA